MRAMILAAGEGTRLRPLTRHVPKPMIPIVGVPLLARTLAWLGEQGVTEAAVNLFHRPQSIPEFFGDVWSGIRLRYFFEDALRGTAGGVKAAQSVFADAPFFVIYGDNLIDADLDRLRALHDSRQAVATLGLFHHPDPTAAGIVGTDGDGRITRFVEKPAPEAVFSDQANAGVYVLDPSIFDFIPEGRPSDFGLDIFPALLAARQPIYGTPLGGYIQDTGTPESYRQANWDTLGNERLWTGTGVQIGKNVVFDGRNVVGNGARIGDGATLTDCILWDDATVGAGETLTRAIVTPTERLMG